MSENEIQRACHGLVHREIYCCASYLVHDLAQGHGVICAKECSDLSETCEQAFELSVPIDDWEEAALNAGFKKNPDGIWIDFLDHSDKQFFDSAEAACAYQGVDPCQRGVFEHWIVSKWFGQKLQERGEKVDFNFCNLVIWARTTTGQAISMDHVIRDIWKSTQI